MLLMSLLAPHVKGHSRDTESALRYVVKAHEDEPLFVIRGRDALAFQALENYRELCETHGLYAMADQVEIHRDRFQLWQKAHTKLTKLPDPYEPLHQGIPTDNRKESSG